MSIQDDRVKRVTRAVLDAEFISAADEYSDEILANLDALEGRSLAKLMRARERFLTLREMRKAE